MSYHPVRSLRGLGADAAALTTPEATNKTSGYMLIGLGALLIVGAAVVLLPKKGYKSNASRKKIRRRRRQHPAKKRRRGKPKFRVVSTATGYVLHTSYTKTAAKKWKARYAPTSDFKVV